MKNKLKKFLKQFFLPEWVVLVFDLIVIGLVFIFVNFLIVNFSIDNIQLQKIYFQSIAGALIFLISYLFVKPHHNIIRHTTIKDFSSIVLAHIIGSACLFGLSVNLRTSSSYSSYAIPASVIVIHFFISVFILLTSRLMVKAIYNSLFLKSELIQNTMVFGTGRLGMIAHDVLERKNQLSYNVVGYIDDNPKLRGKNINGIPVYSSAEAFDHVLTRKNVKEIIFAAGSWEISFERKQQFVHSCLERRLQIKEVADVSNWIKGSSEKVNIQNIKIEDLLGREPISIDINKISAGLSGKQILVTGAAGSIGSEIARKLLLYNARNVILVDQSESALYDFHNELLSSFGEVNVEIIVGDVSDKHRMRRIYEIYRPEIVFHASAYKHVPLMEQHPYEAVKTNIGGTKLMADLAVEFGVEKFVMISTDKAVNPTNVMGASKRICEIYIQSLSQMKGIKTQFITTRFGNVLGSSGSVVPLFKSQIDKGGPVTLTHKDVTRYFMTIPEACQLVLEAGFMGNGSEIYVFDMGSPVKIYDLAEKMIFLSGHIPHKEIQIVVTGLRPGEKLFEELLSSSEICSPTHNDKIKIGKIRHYDHNKAKGKITEMLKNLTRESDDVIVTRMKDLVEEFVSENSPFEKLDKRAGKVRIA